ncbi:MAG TPA: hypothetical protein VK666_16175, partial [Chryseolinea sp.]|nr:hypothetical protein [Chryseolinea sp.]
TEYHDYLAHNDEHPYFGLDDWSDGSIMYDDEFYDNVQMFYDISRDRVITEHILNGAKIELITEKVSHFTINGHKFVHLIQDPSRVIVSGFHEVLYDGKTKVYARREKYLRSRAESNAIAYSFEEKNRLYIFKDGKYHAVRSKGSVWDVFTDKKQDLKPLFNKTKISFKSSREEAIVRIAEQYDALTK